VLGVDVLIVIAKAIVSHASSRAATTLSSTLMRRLRRAPLERAVAGALGDALEKLERKHPRAIAALFDEHFLRTKGAPVLARFLGLGERPSTDDLVKQWSAQLPGAGEEERYAGDDIVAAAGDLLQWFEDALHVEKHSEALGGLLAKRAAHTTARATSQMASLVGSQPGRVLIDTQERYRALDVNRFAGRAWLRDEVDRFLSCRTSGYFVLEGAAGLGKSTFLA
jgi:hypothetical protein